MIGRFATLVYANGTSHKETSGTIDLELDLRHTHEGVAHPVACKCDICCSVSWRITVSDHSSCNAKATV